MIKVADFGLAIDCSSERPVTRAGTLDYMAPEVLICPDKKRPEDNKDQTLLIYGTPVDCWAVGILAFELIVGCPPFEQETRSETYNCIMYKEPKIPDCLSSEARSFILTALTKNAVHRPTVIDLLKHPWIQKHARSKHLSLLDKPGAPMTPQSMHRLGLAQSDQLPVNFSSAVKDVSEVISSSQMTVYASQLRQAAGASTLGSRPLSRSLDLDSQVALKSGPTPLLLSPAPAFGVLSDDLSPVQLKITRQISSLKPAPLTPFARLRSQRELDSPGSPRSTR